MATFSNTQIAETFGVSRRTIHRWTSDGMPCVKGSNRLKTRYDPIECHTWRSARQTQILERKAAASARAPWGREKAVTASERLKQAKAKDLELKGELQRGDLLPRMDFEAKWRQQGRAARSAFSQVAPEIAIRYPGVEGLEATARDLIRAELKGLAETSQDEGTPLGSRFAEAAKARAPYPIGPRRIEYTTALPAGERLKQAKANLLEFNVQKKREGLLSHTEAEAEWTRRRCTAQTAFFEVATQIAFWHPDVEGLEATAHALISDTLEGLAETYHDKETPMSSMAVFAEPERRKLDWESRKRDWEDLIAEILERIHAALPNIKIKTVGDVARLCTFALAFEKMLAKKRVSREEDLQKRNEVLERAVAAFREHGL